MTTRRGIAGQSRQKLIPPAADRSVPSSNGSSEASPVVASGSAAAASHSSTKLAAGVATPAKATFFDYAFKDPALLRLALTHSSLAYESNPDRPHDTGSDNEQLEFIGDAVLGLIVAEALYRRFPASREGELTRMRASLVSSRNLAQVAQQIQLGPMLRLGRGEENSGGKGKPALLANALEAVIAALYLDGGLAPASSFVHRVIIEPAEDGLFNVLRSPEPFAGAIGDYKSALQEHLQATGAGQPTYLLKDQTGPDHQKRFRIEVRIVQPDGSSVTLGEAEGTTKKQAQQEAARVAFASLLSGAMPVRPAAAASSQEIAP